MTDCWEAGQDWALSTSATCNHQSSWITWNEQAQWTTGTTANSDWVQWSIVYYNTMATDSSLTVQWGSWNTQYLYVQDLGNGQGMLRSNIQPQVQLSQAEIDLARERNAQQAREAKEARAKAARLLRQFLDQKQCDTLDKHRWFEVVTPKGRVFRITHGRAGNVYLIEGGRQVIRYCIHPVDVVPDEDTMLAQLLMLKTEEERFEETANKTKIEPMKISNRRLFISTMILVTFFSILGEAIAQRFCTEVR